MRGLSVFLLLFATSSTVAALQLESPHRSRNQRCIHERFPLSKRPANRLQPFVVASTSNSEPLNDEELAYLKQELTAYLALRTKVGADERAKEEIGKVVGGTKGNLILDYVSAAPNKAKVTKVAPNIFDYDELTKYGYGNLVTRIMNAGGRFKMYDLVGLTPPPSRDDSTSSETYTVDAPIVLDRVGEESRYQGLKLGQAFDDESQGEALLEYQRKISNGERPSLSKVKEEVDAYVLPFADKRNVGPRQTPDWTAEKLDEWGRQQGRVESWARQAKEGAFVKDPLENFDSISPFQRAYGLSTALITAVAFGKATPNFVQIVFPNDKDFFGHLIHVAQLPAVIMVLLSLASSAYGIFTATNLNRSQYVWAVKGLLGGPLIVRQLAELPNLVTLQEQQKREEEALGIS